MEHHSNPMLLRSWLLLIFGAASWIASGCVDLSEPWEQPKAVGSGGAGGFGLDAEVVADGSAGGGAGGGGIDGGAGGSGGQSRLDGDVPSDAPGTGGGSDAPLGGTGGAIDASMGGNGGAVDVGAPGTGGAPDAPIGKTGGAGGTSTGGSTGPLDAGQGGTGGAVVIDAPAVESGPEVADGGGSTIPTIGLVAYYPCEQASGTSLPDLSGNKNDGTLVSSSGSSGTSFSSGKIGNALSLRASRGGYVSVPVSVFQGATELTIATWIKPGSTTTWQRIFDVGIDAKLSQNTETGTVYMTFALRDFDSNLGFSSTKDGYGNAQVIKAPAFATGVWTHVAVVLGGGAGTLYLDGVAASTGSSILAPAELGALDYAYLGKSQFTGDPLLDGQIDEFRVYQRALSAGEVKALFEYAGAN
jgi:hypothetical protein